MGWEPTSLSEPNLLNNDPIPELDHEPTFWGVPPGVEADFSLLRRNDGVPGDYYIQRPIIIPRVGVLHTNGASVESSVGDGSRGQTGYGNAGRNNTKPTYVQDRERTVKLMPSNRRCIANSTGVEVEQKWNEVDSSFWSYAIETTDMGTKRAAAEGYAPGDMGPFLNNQMMEHNARIFAYEAIAGKTGRPNVPDVWNGSGQVAHVWPFLPRHFTLHYGKSCPGYSKIWQFFNIILPRAQVIYDAWTAPVIVPPPAPEEPDMKIEAITPVRIDSRTAPWQAKLEANERREVWIADGIDAIPDDAKFAIINVTAIPGRLNVGKGWIGVLHLGEYVGTVNFSGNKPIANQMVVPLRNGKTYLISNKSVNWVLDISGYVL